MKKRIVTEQELRYLVKSGADVTQLDVSRVENMSHLFNWNTTFNQDISKWDVSNVKNMSFMFEGALAFNQDISKWDVSHLQSMSGMFRYASMFNQNLGTWDERVYWVKGKKVLDNDLYKYLWTCPVEELPKYINHEVLAPIVKKRLGE